MDALTIPPRAAPFLYALLTPSVAHYSPTSGAATVDTRALEQALATLTSAERAAFVTISRDLAAHGVALLGESGGRPFAAPWTSLAYAAVSSPSTASDVARALGVSPTDGDLAAAIRTKHPNVPASFLSSATLAGLVSAKPRPSPRASASDIEAVAQCLVNADYSGLEGHWYLAWLGFSITLDQSCATKVANLLLGAGGGAAFIQAAEKAASQGVSAALSAVAASAGIVLELIAAALGENINLVNGPDGCRIECTWPYTGGFFFWADPVDSSPAPKVVWTAPDSGASVGGLVQLEAQGIGVSAIDFSASYATDPANNSTVAWHALGRGSAGQANTWSLNWDASAVPSQNDPGRGLVNICAIGVDDDGNELGQSVRDYRLVGMHNAPRMKCSWSPTLIQKGKQTTVTVTAVDALTNAQLNGTVSIDGTQVALTGQPFPYTFQERVASSVKKPVYEKNEAGKPVLAGYETITTYVYPVGTVNVLGYAPGTATFGFHTRVVTTPP